MYYRVFGIIILFLSTITLIEANCQLSADAGNDTIYCASNLDEITLGGNPTATGGTPPYSYSWSCELKVRTHIFYATSFLNDTTVSNPTFKSPHDTLTFFLTVTDNLDGAVKDTVIVRFSEFVACLGQCRELIDEGDSVQLGHCIEGGIQPYAYHWTPTGTISDTYIRNPWASPTTTTTYDLTLTDSAGCETQSSCQVTVTPRQPYEPILDTNKLWYTHIYIYCCWQINTEIIKIGSDTIVNDTTYYEVLRSTGGVQIPDHNYGYLREDNKRLFYRTSLDKPEKLIYDFGISEGDTVIVYGLSDWTNYNMDKFIYKCDSIRTRDYYQIQRNVYYLWPIIGDTPEYWIEGIGGTSGLLHHYDGKVGGDGFKLSCVKFENNYIYRIDTSGPCIKLALENSEYSSDKLSVYPNPFNDHLTIDRLPNEILSFEIYDINGRLIFQDNEYTTGSITINTADIKPGLYLLRVRDTDSGQTITSKIIAKR